jgi:hypothetical protein
MQKTPAARTCDRARAHAHARDRDREDCSMVSTASSGSDGSYATSVPVLVRFPGRPDVDTHGTHTRAHVTAPAGTPPPTAFISYVMSEPDAPWPSATTHEDDPVEVA